ncbi:hypothetical protein BROSI_A1269 [Candidatus Brocadia sinica JPN1]|uniref:Uncharacterized protein n=1 Tax=Candidatus Brocadia sinica JPN1 TaxID=1197129 RepID=A0ABQ0JVE7_9BACT|nr:hypothetical protein BROSI_A1269 [Candidatus Brocadia sinica JPN1]GIK13715.1 MAG: hypothetical protein BroJett002_24220 [Candidatus Brocadia sinica]GJQ16512.1 MAG: hypothetical protein HBSIN01_04710 [Candidatus Brocadia sinica]
MEDNGQKVKPNMSKINNTTDPKVIESDGFIITTYFTSKIKLEREAIVWQR